MDSIGLKSKDKDKFITFVIVGLYGKKNKTILPK
jgi:hypothetical protein